MPARRPITLVAVATAAAAATLVVPAVAATPAAGLWASAGEGGGVFTVKGSSILPAGQAPRRFITAPSNFKCNSSNLAVKATSIKISGGVFRYDGPAYVDVFRAKKYVGRLIWSGKFTSTTSAKGTYRFRSSVTPVPGTPFSFKAKRCDSGTHAWTGKPAGG